MARRASGYKVTLTKTVLVWAGGFKTSPIVVYYHSGGRAARCSRGGNAKRGFANASNGGGFVVSRSVNAAGETSTDPLLDLERI